MTIVCVIPARSGSKGILNKNIIEFNEKPLIAWTIEAAIKSKKFNKIIVSTDDEKIADISKKIGAQVPFLRPKKLAADKVHSSAAVLHALNWLRENENYVPESVMMLLPTSPLRKAEHIKEAINIYKKNKTPGVISIENLRKYNNNLRYMTNGKLINFSKKKNYHLQRQGQKKIYGVNGSIFLANTKLFLKKKHFI